MNTFTTIVICLDLAFAAFFILRFLVPSLGPALEALIIKIFKKGKKHD